MSSWRPQVFFFLDFSGNSFSWPGLQIFRCDIRAPWLAHSLLQASQVPGREKECKGGPERGFLAFFSFNSKFSSLSSSLSPNESFLFFILICKLDSVFILYPKEISLWSSFSES